MSNSRRSAEFIRSFANFTVFALLLFNLAEAKADNEPNFPTYATCDCSMAEDLIACLRCCAGGCPQSGVPSLPGTFLPGLFEEENEIYFRNFNLNQRNRFNNLNEYEIKELRERLLERDMELRHAE